jgi:hypothetical protein
VGVYCSDNTIMATRAAEMVEEGGGALCLVKGPQKHKKFLIQELFIEFTDGD